MAVNTFGIKPVYLIAGGAVALALLWVHSKGAAGAGAALGGAAVDLANGIFTGSVTAIGGAVGVPQTDMTQCQIDKANGDAWAASFSCPISLGQVPSTAVTTVGGLVGVPLTNQTQCQKDQAAGDTWAASFSCGLTDFLSYAL